MNFRSDSKPGLLKTPVSGLRPGLYLVATPIGNLGDMTYRAVDTLKSVDQIFCEDTRVTARLMRHFDIRTRVRTYHDHSPEKAREQIGDAVAGGQAVALISDAGMPLISDPGFKLVRSFAGKGLFVTSIPGASAPLTALQLSGLATDRFVFAGFLAHKSGPRKAQLRMFRETPATLVFFDTASRVTDSCRQALDVLGDRRAAIGRELTKLFEEVMRGSLSELIVALQNRQTLKGELVLVIERAEEVRVDAAEIDRALRDALGDLPTKQAANQVAEHFDLPKRGVYQRALALKQGLKAE